MLYAVFYCKQAVQLPLLALQFLFVVVTLALVLAKAVVPVLELNLCGLDGICKVDGIDLLPDDAVARIAERIDGEPVCQGIDKRYIPPVAEGIDVLE